MGFESITCFLNNLLINTSLVRYSISRLSFIVQLLLFLETINKIHVVSLNISRKTNYWTSFVDVKKFTFFCFYFLYVLSTRKSSQEEKIKKTKHLENEIIYWNEIKSIIHKFWNVLNRNIQKMNKNMLDITYK